MKTSMNEQNDIEKAIIKMKKFVHVQQKHNFAASDIHVNLKYIVWRDSGSVELFYHYETAPVNSDVYDSFILADIASLKIIQKKNAVCRRRQLSIKKYSWPRRCCLYFRD